MEDANDFMQSGHEDELGPLLALFHDWRRNEPGNELIIAGGDVHVGGFSDIYMKVWGSLRMVTCMDFIRKTDVCFA